MGLPEWLRKYLRPCKFVLAAGGGCMLITYAVVSTERTIERVVRRDALARENKAAAQYIYVDNPIYEDSVKPNEPGGLRSLRYSLMRRLLWLCRHGGREQRNLALNHLAAIKKSKDWDYWKLAQALDAETAVLLARTEGADLRYFLPAPMHVRRSACYPHHISDKFLNILKDLTKENPHKCTNNFLKKYYHNIKEKTYYEESNTDNLNTRRLCLQTLDAVYHNLSTAESNFEMTVTPAHKSTLEAVAESLERFKGDIEVQLMAVKVLTVLSTIPELLQTYFINGLVGHLARWIRGQDVRLSCAAAACLANLAREGQYRAGLYPLHPLYRTREHAYCDVLFLHGLRGGLFVTWRQRDPKDESPLGIFETVLTSNNESTPKEYTGQIRDSSFIADPDLIQVMEDIENMEDDKLLEDYEVVVQDVPESSLRDKGRISLTTQRKREALRQELEDRGAYTSCWPKDWLPRDCPNLRILGVDYWSSVSEWTDSCCGGEALETRAESLVDSLRYAGVGRTPLVAVGHSMGGLVIERALLDSASSDEPEERQIAQKTTGVILYSTPHKGSNLANLPRATAAVLCPSTIVRQLRLGSPMLLQLQKDFIEAAHKYNWEIICFGESKPTLVSPFKVPIHFVSADSADLGTGEFYRMALDHLSICKPASRQSVLYTSLVDILKRVVSEGKRRKCMS